MRVLNQQELVNVHAGSIEFAIRTTLAAAVFYAVYSNILVLLPDPVMGLAGVMCLLVALEFMARSS